MRYLIFCLTILTLSACSKDSNSGEELYSKVKNHVWLYDSFKVYDGSNPTTHVIIEPQTEIRFIGSYLINISKSQSGFVEVDTFNCDYEDSRTLYQWRRGTSRDLAEKLTVEGITDTSLALSYLRLGLQNTDYYHAK